MRNAVLFAGLVLFAGAAQADTAPATGEVMAKETGAAAVSTATIIPASATGIEFNLDAVEGGGAPVSDVTESAAPSEVQRFENVTFSLN